MLDFGLARSSVESEQQTLTLGAAETLLLDGPAREAAGSDARSGSALRTQLGRVLGTPAYMAPEQARGEPVTAASDLYSFGLLLQEICTGRPAYDLFRPWIRCWIARRRWTPRPSSASIGTSAR